LLLSEAVSPLRLAFTAIVVGGVTGLKSTNTPWSAHPPD